MKNCVRKYLAVALSVVLLLSAMPSYVFTAFAETTDTVERIEVNDVSIIEGTDGYWTTDSNGNEYWYYYSQTPGFTVYFNDGTSKTSQNGNSIEINGQYYSINYSFNQRQTHWTAGNTYKVDCTFAGKESSFNVTITESPVDRIEVNNVSVIEHANGSWNTDSNGNKYWDYSLYPTYTVFFRDGTSKTSTGGIGIQIGDEMYWLSYDAYDTQRKNHWTVGNTYSVDCSFMGIKSSFNVSITENPVERVEVSNVSIVQGAEGQWRTDNNGNEFWYYTFTAPSYVVYFKDGRHIYGNGAFFSYDYGAGWQYWEGLSIDGNTYYLTANIKQMDNHWTAGNTYKVDCNFAGVESSFNVSITESPVTRIVVSDVSIIEGTDGYWDTDGNGNKFWQYSNLTPKYTVYFKDGTSKTERGGVGIQIGDNWYSLQYDIYDTQRENHWTVGNTYNVDCTFMGAKSSFNVSITESPVERVEVSDISIIEGTNGNYSGSVDDKYWYYHVSPTYTVYFKDGTSKTLNGDSIQIGNKYYMLNISYDQDQGFNHWTVGNTYKANYTFMGISGSFNVSIIESPVTRVVFNNDLSIIENTYGYMVTDSENNEFWFYEYYTNPSYTVYLNDGTSKTSNEYGDVEIYGINYYFNYTDEDLWNLQSKNHWTIGNTYTINGKVAGFDCGLNVKIISSPVNRVEISDTCIYEGVDGWTDQDENGNEYTFYDNFKPSYTVILNDGTRISSDEYGEVEINENTYYIEYDYEDLYYSQYENHWKAGNTYRVSGSVAGKDISFNVTLKTISELGAQIPEVTIGNPIKISEDDKIYKFIPAEDGAYAFYSQGDMDTYIRLFDQNGKFVSSDHDSGEDWNFYLETNLEAGKTYYAELSILEDIDGDESFTFSVKQADLPCTHTKTEIRNAKDATCTTTGYTGDTYCADCGEKIADGEVIPALGHGKTQVKNKKFATCTEDGYTGDTYCSVCGELLEQGEIILKKGHQYVWKITKVATKDENGLKEEVCTFCGEKTGNTEVLLYTGHVVGDIDGSGTPNNQDLVLLFQYLSGWDVTVDETAVDVNGDGKNNNQDLVLLFQFLSGWNVEIF